MRDYTSKSQKVEMYAEKYNLPREEVHRILSEHEANLTLDELKIKYDDPNIGQLPQWLIDEGGYDALQQYIETGVKSKFDFRWSSWTTIEDLVSYMWEFILKRIHTYNTRSHIISAVKNRMVWLWRENFGRGSYFKMSLQDEYGRNDEGTPCTYGDIMEAPKDTEITDLIEMIDSVYDEATRGLLVIVGYLNGIKELEPYYNKVVNGQNLEVQEKLSHYLRQYIEKQDELILKDQNKQFEEGHKKPRRIALKDIIKATGYNINMLSQNRVNVTTAVSEVEEFINYLGIKPNTTAAKTSKEKQERREKLLETYKDRVVKYIEDEPIPVKECKTIDILQHPDLISKYGIKVDEVKAYRQKVLEDKLRVEATQA